MRKSSSDSSSNSSHPKPWMEDKLRVTPDDLQRIISGPDGITMLPNKPMDEVYPGIYVGEHAAASNVLNLQRMKFTHVLNVALGKSQYHSNTNREMYDKVGIKFMGIAADDTAMYNFLPHFHRTSRFIHEAVSSSNGKILVHCRMGASRSATVVIAYLMLRQGKSVTEATRIVKSHRDIAPNPGFLGQLCKLQEHLDNDSPLHTKKSCSIS